MKSPIFFLIASLLSVVTSTVLGMEMRLQDVRMNSTQLLGTGMQEHLCKQSSKYAGLEVKLCAAYAKQLLQGTCFKQIAQEMGNEEERVIITCCAKPDLFVGTNIISFSKNPSAAYMLIQNSGTGKETKIDFSDYGVSLARVDSFQQSHNGMSCLFRADMRGVNTKQFVYCSYDGKSKKCLSQDYSHYCFADDAELICLSNNGLRVDTHDIGNDAYLQLVLFWLSLQ